MQDSRGEPLANLPHFPSSSPIRMMDPRRTCQRWIRNRYWAREFEIGFPPLIVSSPIARSIEERIEMEAWDSSKAGYREESTTTAVLGNFRAGDNVPPG